MVAIVTCDAFRDLERRIEEEFTRVFELINEIKGHYVTPDDVRRIIHEVVDPELLNYVTKQYLEEAIRDIIGRIPRFKSCDGKDLPLDAKIATCEDLNKFKLLPNAVTPTNHDGSTPTHIIGKDSSILGEPDNYLEFTVDGQRFVVPAYAVK